MTDRREPIDTILDIVVYAPIGAFFHGPEVLDEMASRGRQQVANAKVIGRVAVERGRGEAQRIGATAQQHITDALVAAARAAGAPLAGADAPDARSADASPADAGPPDTSTSTDEGEATGPSLHVVRDDAPDATDLPIPDYDNLSASQVVPRLDDLGADELDAVRTYEQAHRGRMTILSRIAQLQAS